MIQSFRISFLLYSFLQFTYSASGQGEYADCGNAKILCDKSPIVINELMGYGSLPESSLAPCFQNDFQETNSIWLKWKVAEAGTLTFTILPLDGADDIDFVLFRVKGLENCALNEPVRCMAAGPNLGVENEMRQGCTGATGLRTGINKSSKSNGCTKDAENFLSTIEMKVGEYYALFINNFRSTGGILVEWGGTATFQPIPGQCTEAASLSRTSTLHDGDQVQFSDAFPNPTTNRVNISAFSTEEYDGQLQVISADGQLELSLPFTLSSGNNLIELPTENLRTGAHFIRLQTSAESYLLRFIKH